MGMWGKEKQFYVGSVAVAKLGAWSVLCLGVMSHCPDGEGNFPEGELCGQQCKASGRCSTERGTFTAWKLIPTTPCNLAAVSLFGDF